MKRCRRCTAKKPLSDFSLDRSRKDGRAVYCLDCYALQVKAQRCKQHGTTLESVQRMLKAQRGVCACCKQRPVSLAIGRVGDKKSQSFIDFRRGWGFAAGIVCAFCMPQLNTVKNNKTSIRYLQETSA